MSSAGFNVSIRVEQGCDFTSDTYVYQTQSGAAIDLTAYSAAMKVRTSQFGSGSNPGTVVLSLTSGSGITLGGVAGTIVIKITHTQTLAIASGTYWFDLLLTDGSGNAGNVTKILSGTFVVGPTDTQ